jgi:hypothetical protein
MSITRQVCWGLIGLFLVVTGLVPTTWADSKAILENAKARRGVARRAFEKFTKSLWGNTITTPPLDFQPFYLWSRRWMQAELDLSKNKAEKIAAFGAHLSRMKKLQQVLKSAIRHDLRLTITAVDEVPFYCLEAEKWL